MNLIRIPETPFRCQPFPSARPLARLDVLACATGKDTSNPCGSAYAAGGVYSGQETGMNGVQRQLAPTLQNPAVLYYAWDHLGTIRLITNDDLTIQERHDYEPYGLELPPYVNQSANTHQFTGHERDLTSGFDYMHFRYFGSTMGRFCKPDNISGKLANPQSWNRYSYVVGNPVNFNDPTGHLPEGVSQEPTLNEYLWGEDRRGDGDTKLDSVLNQMAAVRAATAMVDSFIAAGGINGNFSVTSEVLTMLETNKQFRNGFILWLSTDTGRTQYENMASDKNTSYTMEIGICGGTAETIQVAGTLNPPSARGEVDYGRIRIILNSNDFNNGWSPWMFAKTIGHEGFHADNWGSGKYTKAGAGRRDALLDPADYDKRYLPMRRYLKEMAAFGFYFPSAEGTD